ncbi:hypothetical protein JTE90_002948 [Oedothorax gibbosus]|uniref:Uncharacterized protein n=1 Tax=Oedothorax gibbosus TaxID=931172 RepID=A0AAV6UKG8_9ARAC|nr:hypothetical protein JTE90_002948 [Oedothorax gibbosus]
MIRMPWKFILEKFHQESRALTNQKTSYCRVRVFPPSRRTFPLALVSGTCQPQTILDKEVKWNSRTIL